MNIHKARTLSQQHWTALQKRPSLVLNLENAKTKLSIDAAKSQLLKNQKIIDRIEPLLDQIKDKLIQHEAKLQLNKQTKEHLVEQFKKAQAEGQAPKELDAVEFVEMQFKKARQGIKIGVGLVCNIDTMGNAKELELDNN